MASAPPRVSVTLTQEQFDILSKLGKLQRRPVSTFIRELLDAAMPALRATLPILEAREKSLAEQPETLQRAAQGLLDAFSGMDPDQLSLLDISEQDISDLANRSIPPGEREPGEGRGARAPSVARVHAPIPPRTTAARGKRR
jgi:hypothetical protein